MNENTRKKPELLLPAGSFETVRAAVNYGADSVYIGTPDMSMRTKSKLSLEDVVKSIDFAHENGLKVYLTLNLISHNKDIAKLPEYLETVRKVSPDGLIISDLGVFSWVRSNAPEIPLHVSTQANICSWLTVKEWQNQGASLVVLGREVSFAELCEIREQCQDIKIEVFVQGAMCMTYSGRCLLSNFMAERGANQGNCANSCRWNYKLHLKLIDGTQKELEINEDNSDLFEFLLEEGYRPGDYLPIEESERGSYILNSRDLCLMPKLDEYMKIGVDVFKIEGRNRSPYYVSVLARAYRNAIDDWFENPQNWNYRKYMREIETVGSRGYTLAFHNGRLSNYAHGYENTSAIAEWEYAGFVNEINEEEDYFTVVVKNRLDAGDVLEFVPFQGLESILLRLYEFVSIDGSKSEVIHAGQKQELKIPFSAFDHECPKRMKELIKAFTIIRKERALTSAQIERIKHDRVALRIDGNQGGSEQSYIEHGKKLIDAIEQENVKRENEEGVESLAKSPRIGTKGCCGKGCNGCMIFWHDPEYEKARELLAKKKQGEKL